MSVDQFRFGLIGYPLEHSLSPRLHRAAFEATGLTGEYRLYPIPPGPEQVEKLQTLLDSLRRGKIHGLNVTIPLKRAVIPFLDEMTLTALGIGAVNTIFYTHGRVVGDNTDAAGFWADLTRLYPSDAHQPAAALILGAGGAARAVAYALYRAGWRLSIAARRVEQAQDLIQQISCQANNDPQSSEGDTLSAIRLSSSAIRDLLSVSGDSASAIGLVVNTTPVGTSPHSNATPWPENLQLPEGVFVYDLVYNPAQTLLIRQARQKGLVAANGLGMLVEQAALAFERWTGSRPARQALYRAVSEVQE